jgi:hypothetical protein
LRRSLRRSLRFFLRFLPCHGHCVKSLPLSLRLPPCERPAEGTATALRGAQLMS